MTRYRTIVADPPWPQPQGGAKSRRGTSGHRWDRNVPGEQGALPYSTMTITEIAELPLLEWVDRA